MRYSILWELWTLCARVPKAVWCYFFHSWKDWECNLAVNRAYEFTCQRCKRNWQRYRFWG